MKQFDVDDCYHFKYGYYNISYDGWQSIQNIVNKSKLDFDLLTNLIKEYGGVVSTYSEIVEFKVFSAAYNCVEQLNSILLMSQLITKE
jgi:hypothetical protein